MKRERERGERKGKAKGKKKSLLFTYQKQRWRTLSINPKREEKVEKLLVKEADTERDPGSQRRVSWLTPDALTQACGESNSWVWRLKAVRKKI